MAMAKLTLSGLDRWLKSGMYEGSQDLFDLLTLPDGVNRETFVNGLLYRSGEFPVAFMNGEAVREQIGLLSSMWQESMQRTWDALQAEYNPIHNFDRMEEYTDDRAGTADTSGTSETTDTSTASQTLDHTESGTSSNNGTAENAVMGDTATAYNPNTKDTTTGSGSTSGTSKDTTSGNAEGTSTGKTTGKSSTTDKLTHSGHLYGNIGVTTSQQMLEAELALRMESNWYNLWVDKFVSELCIGIY